MSGTYVHTPDASAAPEADGQRFRFAARCLRWATGTLAAAAIAIGLFFGGAGAVFGPINDVTTAATLLLLVPGVLAVARLSRGRAGAWFAGLSYVTVAGLGLAAFGLLALVGGAITLNDSFLIGGIGMLPFLAWLGAFAFAALRRGVLTRRVGWLSGATLGICIVATAASPFLPMNLLVFALGLPLMAILVAWLWFFGTDLLAA